MKTVELNQTDFDTWWEGKTDVWAFGNRNTTCPIARYLRETCGVLDACVTLEGWYRTGGRRSKLHVLPMWVKEYIRAFDAVLVAQEKERGWRE